MKMGIEENQPPVFFKMHDQYCRLLRNDHDLGSRSNWVLRSKSSCWCGCLVFLKDVCNAFSEWCQEKNLQCQVKCSRLHLALCKIEKRQRGKRVSLPVKLFLWWPQLCKYSHEYSRHQCVSIMPQRCRWSWSLITDPVFGSDGNWSIKSPFFPQRHVASLSQINVKKRVDAASNRTKVTLTPCSLSATKPMLGHRAKCTSGSYWFPFSPINRQEHLDGEPGGRAVSFCLDSNRVLTIHTVETASCSGSAALLSPSCQCLNPHTHKLDWVWASGGDCSLDLH